MAADGLENRPVHKAYLCGKIPCPCCKSEAEKKFYDGEAGLTQHFRFKHAGVFAKEMHMGKRNDG